jgi:hypothetical protein
MAQFSPIFKSQVKPVKQLAAFCLIADGELGIIIRHLQALPIGLKIKTFKGLGPYSISLKTNVKKIKSR